jgi:hypothetical protein
MQVMAATMPDPYLTITPGRVSGTSREWYEVASSAGDGAPAKYFPVDQPNGLAVDRYGNLFVSSTYAVRELITDTNGIAAGDSAVITIYGTMPRTDFPESVTICLSGLTFQPGTADDNTLYVMDACQGFVVALNRQRD